MTDRWRLLLFAALCCAGPALADMYPDGSNAKLPEARTSLMAAGRIADDAALAASSVADYPDGVWRDDFSPGRGAPALRFVPQTGACGIDDGGGCRNDAAGNSWKAVHPGSGIDIRQFGAPTDGIASSTAAIQAAFGYAMSLPNGGNLLIPPGDWVVDGVGLKLFPIKQLGLIFQPGARILCNMTGAANACIDATSATDATRSSKRLITYNLNMDYDSRVTAGQVGAVLFRYEYANGLNIKGHTELRGYRDNTLLSIGGCWNCAIDDMWVWGGGRNWVRKDGAVAACSITSGTTALTCAGGTFSAGDTGRPVTVVTNPGTNHQKFTMTYVSDTQVTTSPAAGTTTTSKPVVFDGVRGATTSGGATITLEGGYAPVAADVGRIVYALGAGPAAVGGGTGVTAYRGKITGVSGQVLTVDAPVTGAVATPSVALAATYIVPSPAVDIHDLPNGNSTNYFVLQIHNEDHAGVGLVQQGGSNVRWLTPKIAPPNTGYGSTSGTFDAIYDGIKDTQITGADFEGSSSNGFGKIYVSGCLTGITFTGTMGFMASGEKLIYKDNVSQGCVVSADGWLVSATNVDATSLANAFSNAGTGPPIIITGPVRTQGQAAYRYDLGTPTSLVLDNATGHPALTDFVNASAHTGTNAFTSSSTTLAALGGMDQVLSALSRYSCSGEIYFATPPTVANGFKVELNTSDTLTTSTLHLTALAWNGTTPVAQGTATAMGATAISSLSAMTHIWLSAAVQTSAAGTLRLRGALNTASGSVTVGIGNSRWDCHRAN